MEDEDGLSNGVVSLVLLLQNGISVKDTVDRERSPYLDCDAVRSERRDRCPRPIG
jgi:hypothetical protein